MRDLFRAGTGDEAGGNCSFGGLKMNRIRLILADDHVMVAQGLQSLLCDEFDLLGTVGNGRELVEWTLNLKPDAILVDISMPILNGFDAVRELRKRGSEKKNHLLNDAQRCRATGRSLSL